MSFTPADVDLARSIVAKALSLSNAEVSSDAHIYGIPTWDSLGQLSIVIAIEETLRVEITDSSVFQSLSSIGGIAAYISTCRHVGGWEF